MGRWRRSCLRTTAEVDGSLVEGLGGCLHLRCRTGNEGGEVAGALVEQS